MTTPGEPTRPTRPTAPNVRRADSVSEAGPADAGEAHGQPPRAAPALAPPSLRRAAYRPLSWRNPWTLLLGVLAAFQAGVITTLLWTSGNGKGSGATVDPSATASTGGDQASEPSPPTSAQPAPTAPATPATAQPAPAATPAPAAHPDQEQPRPRTRTTRDRTAPPTPPAEPAPTPAPTTAPTSAPEGGLVEVEILSEPEGATVKIAGAVWGVTPLTAFLPVTAPVEVKLELEGHAPAQLRWSPSGKRVLRLSLKPLENP